MGTASSLDDVVTLAKNAGNRVLDLFKSECPICCERKLAMYFRTNPACQHTWCKDCLRTWIATKYFDIRRAKELNIRCLHSECDSLLSEQAVVNLGDKRMDALLNAIALRKQCLANHQYEAVECPKSECVGVGYKGKKTIMCFVCEHQWIDESFGWWQQIKALCSWMFCLCTDSGFNMAGVKPCPSCGMRILKNGGCMHMTCIYCRHEFHWVTLRPWIQSR